MKGNAGASEGTAPAGTSLINSGQTPKYTNGACKTNELTAVSRQQSENKIMSNKFTKQWRNQKCKEGWAFQSYFWLF